MTTKTVFFEIEMKDGSVQPGFVASSGGKGPVDHRDLCVDAVSLNIGPYDDVVNDVKRVLLLVNGHKIDISAGHLS